MEINYRTHLVCFRDHSLVRPIVQCLKQVVLYILSISLVAYGKEVGLIFIPKSNWGQNSRVLFKIQYFKIFKSVVLFCLQHCVLLFKLKGRHVPSKAYQVFHYMNALARTHFLNPFS